MLDYFTSYVYTHTGHTHKEEEKEFDRPLFLPSLFSTIVSSLSKKRGRGSNNQLSPFHDGCCPHSSLDFISLILTRKKVLKAGSCPYSSLIELCHNSDRHYSHRIDLIRLRGVNCRRRRNVTGRNFSVLKVCLFISNWVNPRNVVILSNTYNMPNGALHLYTTEIHSSSSVVVSIH